MRRSALIAVTVALSAACSSGTSHVANVPAPAPVAVPTEPVTVPAPAPTPEDSVADLLALEALHELEFQSLGKGSGHVRGVVGSISLPVTPADAYDAPTPRGGPASADAPTYDIDVVSFADRDRVRYYEAYFLGPARERFAIWLGRLPRYEGMIRERFRALGIPQDLVYLALIESGYSNTAVSRANAVGMWQFIASTARLYDLTIDTWVDERRDPFKATDAAGRHLADLYEVFGSWYLAAAAYNGGAGRVTRGIRRLRSNPDSVTDETFFDLSARRYLRRETRDYVPKLIAAALVAKDPLRFGFDSIPALARLTFDEVTVTDQTGLDVLATLAETTPRALMELNPHYYRGVTPPGRVSIVRVPRGTGGKVARGYSDLPANQRVNFVEHVVRSGETLSEIGQRYGVSVRLLRAANDNVHPKRLRVGRRLVVPVSPAARSRTASGYAPKPSPPIPGARYHTVRRGESLWSIAQRYGVTISDLSRWNDMDRNGVLRVGARLAVAPPPSLGS
jgi:membrane-bound lytic murein transglycosylase D